MEQVMGWGLQFGCHGQKLVTYKRRRPPLGTLLLLETKHRIYICTEENSYFRGPGDLHTHSEASVCKPQIYGLNFLPTD